MDRRFYIAIIIVLLAFGALEFNSGAPGEYQYSKRIETGLDHGGGESIELRNNSELQDFAEERDLSGDGTEDYPYILYDKYLDGRGESAALYLSNIDLHLRVEDSVIHNSSDAGIVLFRVSNLTMVDNEIKEVGTGLYIEDSYENLFLSNVFYALQTHAVDLRGSSVDNRFYENGFEGCGIIIQTDEKNVGAQEIHTSNTVNERPIYYVNHENREVIKKRDIGQLIIAKSSEIEVRGSVINSGSVGITILYSENVSVRDVTTEKQRNDGIQIRGSNDIVIKSSYISENQRHGINVQSSNNITITDNLIEWSEGYGITLDSDSIDNDIFLNAFRWNRKRVHLYSDSYRSQAKDGSSSNRWNSSEGFGNYWEPWDGVDEEGDGFISRPYVIEGDQNDPQDDHPLSSTIGPPENIVVEPRDRAAKLNWSGPIYSIYRAFDHVRIYRGISEDNVSYYERKDASIRGMMDRNLSNDESYHYRFQAYSTLNGSVVSPSFEVVPDGTPPTVVEFSPTGEEVPINSTITVRFSEDMLEESVDISVDDISGEVIGGGSVYHFIPDENLSFGETYHVNVTGKDIARNQLEEEYLYWSFTTTLAAWIRGRVIYADGEPIDGAVVTSDQGDQNTTDSDGRFEIGVRPGSRTIRVNKEGYFEEVIEVELESGEDKDLGVIEMEKEERGGMFSRWFWPLMLFALVMIILGIAASVTSLRAFKESEGRPEEEEDVYEEDYEDLTQEEFDSWWEED